MKGVGTNNRALIRLLVTRCEIDLVNIKEEYEILYQKSLADHVAVSIRQCYLFIAKLISRRVNN